MLNAVDLDRGDGNSGQLGEQDPPQAVAQGDPIAALEGFYHESSIRTVRSQFFRLDSRLFDLNHL